MRAWVGPVLVALVLAGCAGSPPADPAQTAPASRRIEFEMMILSQACAEATGCVEATGGGALPRFHAVGHGPPVELVYGASWDATTPAADRLRFTIFFDDGSSSHEFVSGSPAREAFFAMPGVDFSVDVQPYPEPSAALYLTIDAYVEGAVRGPKPP